MCTNFRNGMKSESLVSFSYLSCFEESGNKFYISRRCIYCVYTAMPFMQNIVQFTYMYKKAKSKMDTFVEVLIVCLQSGLCSITVY